MTKHFLLSTAAAALIAGSGFAYAQGTGMGREGAGGGSTMQQNAPSTEQGRGSAATPMRNDASDSKGMSREGATSGSESKQHAQDTNHGKMRNEKSAEDSGKSGDRSKSMRSESNESGKSEKNMRAEDRNGKAMDRNRSAEERNGMKSDSSKSAVDTNRSSTTTTGQAGSGAKLSTEQRTKITTVIRNQHVQPTTNVNFSIAVGTRVPRTVSFHPLPTEIVEIYPSWRGYEFFLVRDEIIVVDPQTLEIVAVLNA